MEPTREGEAISDDRWGTVEGAEEQEGKEREDEMKEKREGERLGMCNCDCWSKQSTQ